ncbi:MAG TPA: argininosuccinate lyase [Tepidisphaeraceae bacterium]|nr:argininosuccinate lyase [Tepidisphaeraceae bacterium]
MSTPEEQPKHPEKSWQSRIGEATDAIAQSFVESISYDRRIYKQDIAGSLAHAAMLAKVGLITEDERARIEQGLRSIERDIEAGNFTFDEAMEDIHMVVEAELIKRVGEPGKKLHTGRSRNDQVATDLLMWLQQARLETQVALQNLMSAFVTLAGRSSDIVMPSYTHLQRAQPVIAGAEALAWAVMFDRDLLRLDYPSQHFHMETESLARDDSPFGSGAIAGSSLPIDAQETSKVLGFLRPPHNSIEATASRDQGAEFLFALAMISMHLSRWAEQWIIYMTTEFGFIKIADRYTTSSSMMPQKRNPDMLELIRGRCGNVYGDLFALMTILKGLPIGYNRDLQEDKRIVFRAYDTVSSCLTMAAAIVNSASYDKERIEPTLDRGFLDATSLAEYLVTKGVPFRTAHHVVGTLVAQCEREAKHALSQLSVQQFNDAIAGKSDVRVTDDVYNALGAHNVVKRYQSAGAAGGKPFQDQLAAWKQRLGM